MDFVNRWIPNQRERVYKHSTVNADAFDKRQFNSLLNKSKGLQQLKEEGDQVLPLYSQLMGDIWSALYKSRPKLLEEIPEELLANQAYMETVMKDAGFDEYRKTTRFDEISSALSTISFGNKVLNWIREQKETDERFSQSLQQALDDQKHRSRQDGEKKDPDQMNETGEHLKKSMETLAEELKKKLDDSSCIRTMLEQSVEESRQCKEKMKKLVSGTGQGSGKTGLEELSVKERFELAEMLQDSPYMNDIADWAGRFKEIAKTKQKRLHKKSMERRGVALRGEVDRLLPSELASLALPQAKVEFMRKLAEGEAMVYDNQGKERLGIGPIILCMDQSGSMRKMDKQSKGFVLAMMSIAKRQKRDFSLITFAQETRTQIFQKGKMTTEDLYQLASGFFGGGTNFYEPLRAALKLIQKSRFQLADLIFVTDGQAHLTDDFLREFTEIKEKRKFQCLSVLVGQETNEEIVERFSDRIIHVSDLTRADAAFAI